MMYLYKYDAKFEELNDEIEKYETSNEISIDKYFAFMTETVPELITTYTKIDLDRYPLDSPDISEDSTIMMHNSIILLKVIEGFKDRCTQRLSTLLISGKLLLEQNYVDSLRKFLETEKDSPKEQMDLIEYLFKTKDNPKTTASAKVLIAEYVSNLNIGTHVFFLGSMLNRVGSQI